MVISLFSSPPLIYPSIYPYRVLFQNKERTITIDLLNDNDSEFSTY